MSRHLWYDREGQPIDSSRANAILGDPEYKRVAQATVGKAWVSTVWMGIDHSYGDGDPPLIFETMVFGGKHDQHQERYTTESEAKAGHKRIVRMVTPWWKRWGVGLRNEP